MALFESLPRPFHPSEKLEFESRRKTELKNAKGEFICVVEERFEKGLLKGMILHGVKEGQPTSIDLFQLVGAASDTKLKVLIKGPKGGEYDLRLRQIIAPIPNNAVNLSVLLHEFGHYSQLKEAGHAALYSFGSLSDPSVKHMEKLFRLIPEAVTEEDLVALERARILKDQAQHAKESEHAFFEKFVLPLREEKKEKIDGLFRDHFPISQEDFLRSFHEADLLSDDAKEKKIQEIIERFKEVGLDFGADFPVHLLLELNDRLEVYHSISRLDHRFTDKFKHRSPSITQNVFDKQRRFYREVSVFFRSPDRFYDAFERLEAEYQQKLHEPEQKWSVMTQEYFGLSRAAYNILRTMFLRVRDLPRLIGERDATARALKWMRHIKRVAGIDLLQEVLVPLAHTSLYTLQTEGYPIPRELSELFAKYCHTKGVGAATPIVIKPQASLKAGLATYGALPANMRKLGVSENSIGKMPRIQDPNPNQSLQE